MNPAVAVRAVDVVTGYKATLRDFAKYVSSLSLFSSISFLFSLFSSPQFYSPLVHVLFASFSLAKWPSSFVVATPTRDSSRTVIYFFSFRSSLSFFLLLAYYTPSSLHIPQLSCMLLTSLSNSFLSCYSFFLPLSLLFLIFFSCTHFIFADRSWRMDVIPLSQLSIWKTGQVYLFSSLLFSSLLFSYLLFSSLLFVIVVLLSPLISSSCYH